MATYFTDFSEYTTGVQPSDWTARNSTNANWTVEADAGATGGKVLFYNQTGSNGLNGLTWDDIDSDVDRDDVEIVARLRFLEGSSGKVNLICRASGGGLSTAIQYEGGLEDGANEVVLGELLPGYNQISSAASGSLSLDTWYWVRFRAIGSALKVRFWADTESEPATWDLENTDTSITAAGWVGLSAYDNNDWEVDLIGIGTDGDTAPTSGAQTVSVGQATETSSATSMVLEQTVSAGQATETDTASAVTGAKAATTGQATETDTASAVTGAKAATTGQATETTTASAVTGAKAAATGQATETDSANAVTHSRTELALQAAEATAAYPVVAFRTAQVAQATETSSASALTIVGQITVQAGLASETATASAVGGVKAATLALASETVTASAVGGAKAATVGLAGDTSTATALGYYRAAVAGMATEGDTAKAVTHVGGEQPVVGEGDFWIIKRRRRWV